MSLRTKTVGLITLTLLCLLVIVYAISRILMRGNVESMEEQVVTSHLMQALNVLKKDYSSLYADAGHSARMTEFQTGLDVNQGAKPTLTLSDETLCEFRITLFVVLDADNKLICHKYLDLTNKSEIPLSDIFRHLITEQIPLLISTAEDTTTPRIFRFPDGPMLIATRPIIATAQQTPYKGTLVLGRALDRLESEHVTSLTGHSTMIVRADSAQLPADFDAARRQLMVNPGVFIQALSDTQLAGYACVRDVFGQPAVYLRVDMPHALHALDIANVRYGVIAFLAVGLIIGLFIVMGLQKVVLSRLTTLNAALARISKSGSPSIRVPVTGGDELSDLSAAINDTLSSLEQSQSKLKESEERYRCLFDESLAGNFISRPDGRLVLCNRAFANILGYKSVAEIMTANSASFYPSPQARVEFLALLKEKKALEHHELELVRRDGKRIAILENVVGTFDANGELVQHQGNIFDISDRKQVEQDLRENQRVLSTLMSNLPGMAYRCRNDRQWTMEFVSDGCLSLTGYSSEELVENELISYADLIVPEDQESVWSDVQSAVNRCDPFRLLYRIKTKQGSEKWVYEQGQGVFSADEQLLALEGFITDISERMRAEQELRNSETMFRGVFEQSSLGMAIVDAEENILDVNPAFEKMLGYSHAEFLAMNFTDVTYPGDTVVDKRIFNNLKEHSHNHFEVEKRYIHKSGDILWARLRTFALMGSEDEIRYVVGMVEDITERKRIERENEKALGLLRATLESTADGILVLDSQAKIIAYNQKFATLWRIPQELLASRNDRDILDYSHFQLSEPDAARARARDLNRNLEHESSDILELKDGRVFERYSQPYRIGDQALGRVWSFHDVTKDTIAERSLRESERFNRDLLTLAPEGIAYLNSEGRTSFANPALLRFMEDGSTVTEEEQLKSLSDLIRRALRKDIARLLSGEMIRVEEVELISPKGIKNLFNVDGAPRLNSDGEVIGGILMFANMTAYKELQGQLRLAQKLEAVGTLAGGVAHDFNNLLTAIMGNLELALASVPADSPALGYMNAVLRSSSRAAELTAQLLAFSRRRMEKPRPANLNGPVDEVVPLMRRTIDPKIELHIEKDPNLWVTMADTGQMGQVLMNLLVNARDAMPDGGRITIRTQNVTLSEEEISLASEARTGEFICLSVEDEGAGMSAEIQSRIFEPFFTTKEPGQGTGLGLAVVYGIVSGHHGWIDVETREGAGTKFRVFLPQYKGTMIPESEPLPEHLPRGDERILLVDDQQIILDVGGAILRRAGYQVITAEDGVKALEIYRAERDSVDLVILDLSMPRQSGRETLLDLLKLNPKVKVMISSGYDDRNSVADLIAKGARGFLQKPYRIHQILQAVRKVLDLERM
jgi:PAS domain S-box-containing protein